MVRLLPDPAAHLPPATGVWRPASWRRPQRPAPPAPRYPSRIRRCSGSRPTHRPPVRLRCASGRHAGNGRRSAETEGLRAQADRPERRRRAGPDSPRRGSASPPSPPCVEAARCRGRPSPAPPPPRSASGQGGSAGSWLAFLSVNRPSRALLRYSRMSSAPFATRRLPITATTVSGVQSRICSQSGGWTFNSNINAIATISAPMISVRNAAGPSPTLNWP